MSIVDAVILGLVQGLTEFIPVSSSGHLVLIDRLTDVESSFAFDVLLNIGTLLALVIYFWPKLADIWRRLVKGDWRLVRNLAISTLPVVLIGGLFTDWFDSESVRSSGSVGMMLVSIGALMVLIDRFKLSSRPLSSLGIKSAVFIGLAQALALLPGTSRAGATMLAGRASRLSFKDAAEYSFLLAIPVIAGAIVRSLFKQETLSLWHSDAGAVIIGTVVAFFSGILAIGFTLRYLERNGLKSFGYYRLGLGLVVLLTAIL